MESASVSNLLGPRVSDVTDSEAHLPLVKAASVRASGAIPRGRHAKKGQMMNHAWDRPSSEWRSYHIAIQIGAKSSAVVRLESD